MMSQQQSNQFIAEFEQQFQAPMQAIAEANHYDPFSVLGRHEYQGQVYILVYAPFSQEIRIDRQVLQRVGESDFFILLLSETNILETHYCIQRIDSHGETHDYIDPYCFLPQLSDFDSYLFAQGKHLHIYRILGAHQQTIDDIDGFMFRVWAPNASRVSVVADFNQWDGRIHSMRSIGHSGIWELFIPGVQAGQHYKFEIKNRDSGAVLLKADPYAFGSELRPATASVTCAPMTYHWQDQDWITQRQKNGWLRQAVSIYECHLGSWRRDSNGHFLNYRELAHQLIPYISEQGFTHIEILPITEHPLDASWGYQTTGYYTPTSRYGSADDFRYFVEYCHQHQIGVILDWVPAHFPKDAHGLARFDGTALYEHEDPRKGEHQDWGTLIYNYGRNEVKNFLIANAVFWLEEFHLDGLRVDAVASMLYLDYSREPGQWVANQYGGNENLEAIDFLKALNRITHGEFSGTVVLAEESTSWPQVTRPVDNGGLGFSMKWNMGWMHDTLSYFAQDPVYRQHHHQQLTFGLLYCFSENFVLPFSHDEVVHGKASMLHKMPGDEWQQFANLRLLYSYQFTYPGKKLLFMGNEFAQRNEWNEAGTLDWNVLQHQAHQGMQTLVRDLNRLYRSNPALHYYDFDYRGFEWLNCDDAQTSVLSYFRKADDQTLLIVLNMTPVVRNKYALDLPGQQHYQVIFNSDSAYYGGSDQGSHGMVKSRKQKNGPYQLKLDLPPLGTLILQQI